MFLNELKREHVKPYLDIAYTMIASDGNFSEKEMSLLQMYAIELNLEELPKLDIVDIRSELAVFLDLGLTEKKKLYFELFSLSYADSYCSPEEKELLNIIQKEFGISDDEARSIENITIKILFDYEQLGIIINS